jgi:hypothetical protein
VQSSLRDSLLNDAWRFLSSIASGGAGAWEQEPAVEPGTRCWRRKGDGDGFSAMQRTPLQQDHFTSYFTIWYHSRARGGQLWRTGILIPSLANRGKRFH